MRKSWLMCVLSGDAGLGTGRPERPFGGTGRRSGQYYEYGKTADATGATGAARHVRVGSR
jgi:hypothetical protein